MTDPPPGHYLVHTADSITFLRKELWPNLKVKEVTPAGGKEEECQINEEAKEEMKVVVINEF